MINFSFHADHCVNFRAINPIYDQHLFKALKTQTPISDCVQY